MTFFPFFTKQFKAIAACTRGVAYIELAIVLPVLLIMFLGVAELSLYILIIQKEEKTVSAISNVVTQATSKTQLQDTIDNLPAVVQNIMNPYYSTSNYMYFITDIYYPNDGSGNPPTQKWQCGSGGNTGSTPPGGNFFPPASSQVSINGDALYVGGNWALWMNPGDEVLVTEMYYKFNPLFGDTLLPSVTIYRSGIYPPRYSSGLNAGIGFSICPY